ncbi:MAG: CBS domain-containing protein [Gammaproteobacteria bacterium]|nr:MAG: CBS domain-containing protein [Gammaproteobacteria bacterium]
MNDAIPLSGPALADPCAGHDPLAAPLQSLVKRPPVSCGQNTPVRQALDAMRTSQVGSILVTDRLERPVGVFTLRDLRDRVVLPGYGVDEPIGGVMSPQPFCLPQEALAVDAALAMAQRSIRHVILTDSAGCAVGVVSERDLFALQQTGLSRIATAIRGADGLDRLVAAADDIRALARNLMTQGVGAEQLTRLISELNDQLGQRIIHLALAGVDLAGADWCWLALGSEGRYEQTLLTDQDNGLVFTVPAGETADAMRSRLQPFARRANEWLAACGFPLCQGGIMASNPRWCLSLDEWQQSFGDWIFQGDAPVLLNASIFFDFRTLAGEARLARELRDWLHLRIRDNQHFLKRMAGNALGKHPPLGLVRDFVVDAAAGQVGTLDLKASGTAIFVDAARVMALAAGESATGTAARLRGSGPRLGLEADEVQGWVEAFHFIQQLRMRRHHLQLGRGEAMHNRLDPDSLSAMDRLGLKEAFRQGKRLQARLEELYQF